MRPCSRPRCDFPVGGVGEAYGLCVKHGHEERDRRLRERDAQVRAAAPPAPLRPNLSPTLPRPLSAVVGARPVPVTIQPSAATVAAKETPVSKPMTLAPDADAHPERCRIAKCTRPPRGRGLCNAHVQRAYREGVVDTLGLPSKTPYKAASARKTVAPTAPKPTPPTEPHLSRSEQQIAEQQAAKEEVAKLRAERDAANARAERAENGMYDLKKLVAFEFAYAPGADLDLFAWVRDIASKVREVKVRLDDAEKAQADLSARLEGVEQSEQDLLDESIEVARTLKIDTDGDYDLLVRAREVMGELADVRAKLDDANTRAERAEQAHTTTLEQVCAELGIDLDGAADWVLDQLREAQHGECVDVPRPWPGTSLLPEPKPHRVKQAGGRDLGVLVGHVTESGLFRVTSGPLAGAVYGCLYSAEPVERPELGEPEPGSTVWVCTTIDEATPNTILTRDGGRFPRAEWGAGRFVRRQSKPATRIASQPTPTVTDDDIPF